MTEGAWSTQPMPDPYEEATRRRAEKERICAYCHKPAQGNAFINNVPYCHSDHDEETTCYMLAQAGETPGQRVARATNLGAGDA